MTAAELIVYASLLIGLMTEDKQSSRKMQGKCFAILPGGKFRRRGALDFSFGGGEKRRYGFRVP